MLTAMWVFPLVAAGVAFVFSAVLFRQFAARRRPYLLVWGIALAMYGVASAAVVVGVLNGWTSFWFELYWALGAVLNVPFLAGGEIQLLARNRTVDAVVYVVLIFITAYTVAVLRGAHVDPAPLLERLPSGKHVFGDGTPAHRLPQLDLDPLVHRAPARHALVRVEDARASGTARPVLRDAASSRSGPRSWPAVRRSPPSATSRGSASRWCSASA